MVSISTHDTACSFTQDSLFSSMIDYSNDVIKNQDKDNSITKLYKTGSQQQKDVIVLHVHYILR